MNKRRVKMNEDQASVWWTCFICQLALSWRWQISPQRGQMLEAWARMRFNYKPKDRRPARRTRLQEGFQGVLELRGIPPESRFQPKEASCPQVYATNFPHCWCAEVHFTSGKCRTCYAEHSSRAADAPEESS